MTRERVLTLVLISGLGATRRVLFPAGAAVVLIGAFALARTASYRRDQPEVDPGPAIVIPAGAAERLAASLRFPTISHEDHEAFDARAFRAFHRYLQEAFPRVHAELTRETVQEHSLLYTWQGSDPALKPILLLGHQDVVPVEAGMEARWQEPPFGGRIAGGFVWGRGAIDNKSAVVGTLEAVEMLLAQGFRPERTVHLAYGHDEEVGGANGAREIAGLLERRGVELEMVLDEGGVIGEGVLPGISAPVALVGIAEKGFLTVELRTRTAGGHSSLPPRHSAIGILGAAIARLEESQMPLRLHGPTRLLFDRIGPELPFAQRLAFANLWLTRPLVLRKLEQSPTTNAMVRTTTAPTVVQAGTKDNVLPSQARAVVNFRIAPGDGAASVLEHVRRAVDDPRVEIRTVGRFTAEPSAVSSIESESFRGLERAIRAVNPDAIVAPYLVVVATDARHFGGLSENVFRFLPVRLSPEDLARMHGTDERIGIRDYEGAIRTYHRLILDFAGPRMPLSTREQPEGRRPVKTHAHRDDFPTATEGLPDAGSPQTLELPDGARVDLRIAPVAKRIGETTVRMLAYNGTIPGPVLRVRQGSELEVDVVNDGDLEATVHWHGLRLDNRYDGTPETQRPMPIGGRFAYRLAFPDPGVYWYHPHIREDYGQEMGLYGNIVVVPAEPDYWPQVHRELTLTLDDILLEDGKVARFSRSESSYTAMGRFGNVLLVNGEPALSLAAQQGEVVRLYLTNTANTRVFNVSLGGARMKLVGSDSGRYEREQLVESVIIAPSERAVVDVLFTTPGLLTLQHRTPNRTYPLAAITVGEERAVPSLAASFEILRTNADLVAEREKLAPYLKAAPDKALALVAVMDMGVPELPAGATVVYFCPMHAEVERDEPGRCPKCNMKLLARAGAAAPAGYACPMHPEVTSVTPERCPKCGMKLVPAQLVHGGHGGEHPGSHHHGHDAPKPHEHAGGEPHPHDAGGIEWEDDMVEVNRMTTPANTRWKLIDRATGAEGAAIAWRFRVGDRVKIRIVNEMDSDHPMHHPFHIHGAGRFLVLSRDGAVEPNLVWKDTVLVPTGQTVDILLDVTNPGRWMAHCHIAEHHESGMMFSFDVEP